MSKKVDRLCGLVVRVPGYRSRGPGFDSMRYQIFRIVGLEWGPVSLVSTTEELLGRKIAAPAYKTENTAVGIRCGDHAKVGTNFADRSVGILRSRTKVTEVLVCLRDGQKSTFTD
jgi:hypothetical protein